MFLAPQALHDARAILTRASGRAHSKPETLNLSYTPSCEAVVAKKTPQPSTLNPETLNP